MTDEPQFRTVLRGYDQEQVAATVKDLQAALGVARQAAADRTIELTRVLEAKTTVEAELAQVRSGAGGQGPGSSPHRSGGAAQPTGRGSHSFDELGTRVAKILTLAEAEAEQLRTTAADEARTLRQEAVTAAEALRSESEQYAGRVHEAADTEVARLTSAATATADAIVAQANEHARASRAEADQLLEAHRARAAEASAELDAALAERQRVAESELADDRTRHESWVADARSGAESVVAAAHEEAERSRRETQQELADAVRRRDAVHAHLAEVNQLLAVLEDALADAGRLPDPEPTHG